MLGSGGRLYDPPPVPERVDPLNTSERRQLDLVRRFGTLGALLMAVGSLGAGAAPVGNPLLGIPLLGMFTRISTVSMAIVYTGMGVVILAWLWMGRLAAPGRPRLVSRSQLDRTLWMWVVPLSLALPMFSRDAYSYLALGEMVNRGFDPYTIGPAEALGLDHPLTRGVPNIWRETPSPYGPLHLTLTRMITWIVGDHVVIGILLHRLLALAGVAMIVWALPRLARRFGVQPVSALWLGALNPLVLFHLVSGIHNESLTLGLMLAGFELALARSLVLGAAIVTCGALVKVPAALAMCFLGAALARREGGRLSDLFRVTVKLSVVFVVTMVVVCVGSGLGFGWLTTLDTANIIKSWKSPMTGIGQLAGGLGVLLGLGNHNEATVAVARGIGYAAMVLVCGALMWIAFRTRAPGRNPLTVLGIALGAMVLLAPVVHPWYMIMAALPLAAATNSYRFRSAAVVLSILLAVADPPPGMTYDGRAYVIPLALSAAVIVITALALSVRPHMPASNRADRLAKRQHAGASAGPPAE